MKLQANQRGSWRHVADFNPDRRDAVLRALPELARAIGNDVKWSILYDDGKRDWLGSLTDALAVNSKE